MRATLAICKREILSFFVSPVAYFVITGFIFLAGYFFFNYLQYFNVMLARYAAMPYGAMQEVPNLNQWVVEGYYRTLMVILVFLVPLLTMRLIAEERRAGTFELLVTSPVSVASIVMGKFLGVASVIFVMCFLSFLFPAMLILLGNPEALPIVSGFIGLLLLALAFASIGMAVSSFTENQIVAGVSSMVTLLLLYVINSPAESAGGMTAEVLNYLSPVMQVGDLVKGVVSIKAIVYFLSLTGLGIFLSQRALDSYRWR